MQLRLVNGPLLYSQYKTTIHSAHIALPNGLHLKSTSCAWQLNETPFALQMICEYEKFGVVGRQTNCMLLPTFGTGNQELILTDVKSFKNTTENMMYLNYQWTQWTINYGQ